MRSKLQCHGNSNQKRLKRKGRGKGRKSVSMTVRLEKGLIDILSNNWYVEYARGVVGGLCSESVSLEVDGDGGLVTPTQLCCGRWNCLFFLNNAVLLCCAVLTTSHSLTLSVYQSFFPCFFFLSTTSPKIKIEQDKIDLSSLETGTREESRT